MRSFLTILSILVGITTIFIFISFGLGLYQYVNSFVTETSADKVTIQTKGVGAPGLDDTFYFTEEDVTAIERTSGVREVSAMQYKIVEVESRNTKKFVFLAAFDPEKDLITELSNIDIIRGRNLQKGEKGKVVLGYNYFLDDKVFKDGLDVNDDLKVNGEDYKIVGFYEPAGNPQDDSNVYMTEEDYDDSFVNSSGKYNFLIAKVDISNIDRTVSNIEKSLRKSRNLEEGKEDFTVSSFQDLLEQYTSALNIIVGFIILIALISVLVSAINTANTMITSVLERTKEIGVMKSLGASNGEILGIFLFESSFLGFIAGILGVGLGWVLSSLGGQILVNLGWGFLQPFFSWQLFAGCIAFATITGGISGVAPAIHASRVNPVDALRYE